ncbi:hypothetical protein [Bradyrhizobium sp.]
MGKLGDALKKKYKTPREALRALGLDEKLLDVSHLAYDGANPMKATRFGAMTLSATAAAIGPLLAMDQKATLPVGLFKELTSKNFKDGKAKLLTGVRTALDGKLRPGLAMDASMKGVAKVFDAFEKMNAEEMDKLDDAEAKDEEVEAPPEDKPKAYDAEPLRGFMKDCGMDEEQIAKAMDMMPKNGMAGDEETPEEKAAREKKEKDDKTAADAAAAARDAEMKNMVTKPAMDAALAAQAATFQKDLKTVRETERGVRVALTEVKPWVGELPATMAFDSAADVYRHACVMREVEGAKTLHADALFPVLKSLPKIGARAAEQNDTTLAMDSSAIGKALKIAPGLEHIEIM